MEYDSGASLSIQSGAKYNFTDNEQTQLAEKNVPVSLFSRYLNAIILLHRI